MNRRAAMYRSFDEAKRLSEAGLHAEAAATWAVVADVAEELGDAYLARASRTGMRRHLLIDWARRRWPEEGIRSEDVSVMAFAPLTKEQFRFSIYRWNRRPDGRGAFTRVSVSRRGRVTILGED